MKTRVVSPLLAALVAIAGATTARAQGPAIGGEAFISGYGAGHAGPVASFGQAAFGPTPYGYGYGWPWGGAWGGTAAGGYLLGLGAYYQGLGQYNLLTAQALRIQQDTRAAGIDNHRRATETYFNLKRLNSAYAAAANPPLTPERIAAIVEARRPSRLDVALVRADTGEFRWPAALRDAEFDATRAEIEHLFAMRPLVGGGLGSENHFHIERAARRMRDDLTARVRSLPPADYVHAKRFLDGLTQLSSQDDALAAAPVDQRLAADR